MNEPDKPVLLFDGICNFCSTIVTFTIKRDPQAKFMFAPLQSEIGLELLKKFNLPVNEFDSFILIDKDIFYSRSTAALKVIKGLKGIWPLLYIFIIIPAPIRDLVYNFIAKNRYKWFGKKEQCMVPTPDIKRRFLE